MDQVLPNSISSGDSFSVTNPPVAGPVSPAGEPPVSEPNPSQTNNQSLPPASSADGPAPPVNIPFPFPDSNFPPVVNSPQSPTPPSPKSGKTINFLAKGGWVAGPVIMVLCFGLAFYNFTRPQRPEISVQQPELVELPSGKKIPATIKNNWDNWLNNIPKNPSEIEAKSGPEDWAATLESGQTYNYPHPVFTWNGAEIQEPNTNIVGYYVYFGENNNLTPVFEPGFHETVDPQKMGQFQESNTFEAQNLESGKTYYLAIQAVTDSQNPNYRVGYSILDPVQYQVIPAAIIFEYHYE